MCSFLNRVPRESEKSKGKIIFFFNRSLRNTVFQPKKKEEEDFTLV